MVGGDDEQSVLKPRHRAGRGEETLQSHVGIAYRLDNGLRPLGETPFVLWWDGVGVVRRDGVEGGEEGLSRGATDMSSNELQERLVEDAPRAVEVALVCPFGVDLGVVVLIHAVVFVDADTTDIAVEVHRAVVGSVVESGGVAMTAECQRQCGHLVLGVRRSDVCLLHQRRDSAEQRRHRFDAPLAVGKPLHHGGMLAERIYEGGVGGAAVLV